MDYLYYLFIALAFLAVVLMLEGGYFAWRSNQGPEAKRIQKRLQQISAGWSGKENTTLLKQRLLSNSPPLQRLLLKLPRMHSLDKLLLQSGLPMMMSQFLTYSAMSSLGSMAIAALLNWPFLVMLLCAVGGALIPYFYVCRAKRKRLNLIEQQLPETIDLMSRALKAGHAFPGALQMAATEGVEPSATEFRLVFDEINFGVPAQNALINLAARVPITDLRYFVIAVLIQRESGGNLTELLDTISGLIRARLKLLGQIRVLSAEGRLSAWILCSLPFAVGLVMNLVNPGFMDPLWTDPAGHKLVAAAGIMMLLGIYAMSRIIKIRV
ncbi:type II secretion system F family protein [Nitrosomonas communis]|uniref:Tight adherence protein B n=1 Tax=Nitrosomonas communis TaxID=44574 RepID=A0A1I4P5A1_9PROT|nr:type II secretion system F family protein [Nitrosomonas communis]SFM22825.1 tight adherence protein B [Nitrosomonas communis]